MSETLGAAQAQGVSQPKERTEMHTTALVVQGAEHTAILNYSSRRHAGETSRGFGTSVRRVSKDRW